MREKVKNLVLIMMPAVLLAAMGRVSSMADFSRNAGKNQAARI